MKKLKIFYQNFINNQYRKIARRKLELHTILIQVKKGKRKYYLIISKSVDNKTVFHLNRHL